MIAKSTFKLFFVSVFRILLTFGFVFNLSFAALPSISTGRLALMIMLFMYGKMAFPFVVNFSREYKIPSISFLVLIPFTIFWLVFNGTSDAVIFSRILWFLLYSVIGTFLYVSMCRFSLMSAMTYYLMAMLLQAIFVFVSLFNPEFRFWTEQALVNSGNINVTDGVRFSGLSNGGGADLSLQLSFGVAAALILFFHFKRVLTRLCLVLAAIFVTIATIFVGRTGFYIELFMLLGFVFFSRKSLLIPGLIVFLGLMFVFGINLIISDGFELTDNPVQLDRTVSWAFDIFLTGESSSISWLASELRVIREFDVTTLLIGSGRVVNDDGSNYAGHDSGYLHALYALGLPLASLFYTSLLWVYWRLLRNVQGELKLIGLILVTLVFILELKEPFVFKYTLPFFVLTYAYLCNYKLHQKKLS